MRPRLIATVLFLTVISQSRAQKIATGYNPILKETPYTLKIAQHTDDNYLVFGDINYYANELCGSLIKVDAMGKRLSQFTKVSTDRLIEKIIVLPDGKIVIQGSFEYLNGKRTSPIARLNADGTVDETFQAKVQGKIYDIAIQSTGHVIVLTNIDGFNQQLRRLNEDGSNDNSFSDVYVGPQHHVIVGAGDKIYVGDNISIRRLMPNGAADNTYNFAVDASKTISSFTKEGDDKVIAVMNTTVFSPVFSVTGTLQRYNTNGTLDNTFTAGNTGNGGILSVIVRSNGKIALAGDFTIFDSQQGCAVELNSNGTFSRSLLIPDYNGVYAIAEDRSQNIFVTGGFRNANNINYVKLIAKVKADYSLDRSFRVPVSRTGVNSFVPLVSQSNRKLIVGGAFSFLGAANDSSKLIRLSHDGTVDNSFKPQLSETSLKQNRAYVFALAVQSDDKILVGGQELFANLSPSFGRLLPDGQIDNTFQVGTGLGYSTYQGAATRILIKDSKIYVLGTFDKYNGTPCQSLVILDESGKMIGPQQHAIPPNSFVGDIALQSDGKIIISGDFNVGPSDHRRFLRLNTDGSIDNTFTLKNVDGNVIDFEVDGNDNILFVGNFLDFNIQRIIKRYKPNGDIDTSFDLTGSFISGDLLTGYFVKALKNDLLAIGGFFCSYKGAKSSAVVIVDKDGAVVPMETPYDSLSYAIGATYSNNILHMVGRFSNYGEQYMGAAKVIFPVEHIATDYDGKVLSDSSIAVSWEGEFEGADRIVVESSTPDASNFSVIAMVPPNVHSYELKGLSEVTPYHVRIKGANDSYSSPYLTTLDTTDIIPQNALPPTNVTASSFVANWTNVPGTDSCIVQLSDDNFATFIAGYESVVVNGSSLSVNGLEEGLAYQYRVKRFKNKKSSAFSNAITVNVITGIEEPGSLSVNLYPNPVSDQIVVEVPEITNATVVIYSLSGSVVGQYHVTGGSAERIDTRSLSEGMYVVVVSSQGKSKKFKLLRTNRRD
ncbi:MAG TPA: T9SS type A sorting domain-containing protein [Chryseolinea sp.]|nr:T9SS type A sorting domain-containing protein [Chryseolinea sp.]